MNNDWPTKKLGEIANFQKGKLMQNSTLKVEGTTPYILIDDLRTGQFAHFTSYNQGTACVSKDSLLVWDGANAGTVGGGLNGFVGSTITKISPKDEVNPLYLRMFLSSKFKEFNNQTHGAAIPHLNKEFILGYLIPLPPIDKQKEIVEKLDSIRKLQEVNNFQISKIDDLYGNLINKEIRSNKYNTVKLAKVIKPQELINPKKFPDEEYHYIDISSINSENFSVDFSSIKQFKGKDAPSRARKKIEVGDILFSTVRPNLKRIAKVDFPTFNFLASTGFAVLRPDRNKINPNYMGTIICSGIVTEQVLPKVRGAAYPAISDNEVFNVAIPLPERKKQDEIAEKFITLQEYKKILWNKKKNYQNYLKAH